MTHSDRSIIVFGGTGRQGGAVVTALVERGCRVRTITRDRETSAAKTLRDVGVDVRKGSLDDRDMVAAAMADVHRAFLVLPGGLPNGGKVRHATAIADIAASVGVKHLERFPISPGRSRRS